MKFRIALVGLAAASRLFNLRGTEKQRNSDTLLYLFSPKGIATANISEKSRQKLPASRAQDSMIDDSYLNACAPSALFADRPLGITLVGAGGFGASHLRVIEQMESEGLAVLQSVVDPNYHELPQASHLAARGIPCFRDWEEMVEKTPRADCVVLSLPIPLHYEYAAKAYRTGAYVYLEKPPVPQFSQLQELIAMEGADRRIQIGFTFPYSFPMRTFETRLRDGVLGTILSYRLTACWPRDDAYYARASWAGKLRDGHRPAYDGPATNALSHRLHDLLSIEALVSGKLTVPQSLVAELYRARPIESYDVCCARGHFPSGADFSLSLSHAVASRRELVFEVIGSEGKATFHGANIAVGRNQAPLENLQPREEALILAYRDFLDAARQRRSPKVGLIETWPYVSTTNAMFRSSREIHTIGPDHYRHITSQGGVYHVAGLEDLSEKSFRQGKTFSELGVSWAVPGSEVSPEVLSPAKSPLAESRLPVRRASLFQSEPTGKIIA